MKFKTINIFREAIKFAHPNFLLNNKITFLNEGKLIINDETVNFKDKIKLIAFGKAAGSMSEALLKMKGFNNIIEGIVVLPDYSPKPKIDHPNIKIIYSTHPYVTKKSVSAGRQLLSFANKCTKDETVFCLVSGGGSALVASPIDGINVKEKIELINLLIKLGIGEREVNIIRKKLSNIKGGSLAEKLFPSSIINLIISDEREHQLEAIASGPTIKNSSKVTAEEIINENNLWPHIPNHFQHIFKHKIDYKSNPDLKINSFIIGSRVDLFNGIQKVSEKKNLIDLKIINHFFDSNINYLRKELIKNYKRFFTNAKEGKHLIVASGEVPIQISSSNAKGGRNQHLAALIADDLSQFSNFEFLAISSDGCDFINGVHGALITDNHISIINKLSINIDDYLKKFNSFYFHKKIGSLIKGPMTGTNVNDCYLFYFEK